MNIKNLIAVAAITASAMVSTHSFADTNITENVTLTADTDWSGLGLVTVESGVTVELSGCKLSLDGLAGEGSIVTTAVVGEDLTNPTDAETVASTTTNGVLVKMAGNTDYPGKYPAQFAFDNHYEDASGVNGHMLYTDVFRSSYSDLLEINYDFGATTPRIVNYYRIMGYNYKDYTSCPKAWAFEGSDDFATWTELDTRENQTWTKGNWNEYRINNTTAYRYYRLKVTAVTGNANRLYIAEIEYKYIADSKVEIVGGAASDFSSLSFSEGTQVSVSGNIALSSDVDLRSSSATVSIDGTIDLAGHEMWLNGLDGTGTITDSSSFDLTNPSGTVSSTNTFSSSTVAANAFCDAASYDATHRVLANISNQSPIQIDYTFPAATVVNAYRVKSRGISDLAVNRAPKSIKFYGSNDGIEWMELDDRSHETGWVADEERQFEFTNETAYAKYRIEFHANNGIDSGGGNYIEFFKLEYGNTGRFGRLHVAVPSGTKTNSGVTLSGNLRLVKEGAGTLVASKTGQTYGGGTDIVGGTLKPGTGGSNHPFGSEGRDIIVHNGAVLDAAGKVGFGKYEITLDGGILTNTGADADELAETQFRRVRLTKDSSLTSTSDMFFGVNDAEASTVYLGGHTLAVSIATGKKLRFYSMAILDGTFDITSGGWFVVGGSGGIVATNNVDFLAACGLVVTMPVQVDNYTAKWISANANANSTRPIEVYGTFTPATKHFHGVKMQDGSTIDLTGWSGGWPLASDLNAGVKDVLFASGATVTVKLGDKKVEGKKILDWADTSAVVDTLNFVRGDESRGYSLRKMDDGLYYYSGLMIFVQ